MCIIGGWDISKNITPKEYIYRWSVLISTPKLVNAYIHLGGIGAAASGADFGGHVERRAHAPGVVASVRLTRDSGGRRQLAGGGKTKVADLDVVDTVLSNLDEYVIGLEVAVDDSQAVDVHQPTQYLPKQSPDLGNVCG